MRSLLAGMAVTLIATAAQAKCAASPDACVLADGEYHISLPDHGPDNPPVVMFLHGAGGSGALTIRNRAMLQPLLDRGYAVIAPTGGRSFMGRAASNWVFYPGWEGRDETAFLRRVVADAADRFGIDSTRVLLGGFSAGAFMVNYLACAAPDTFAAYAPVSGGFWRPHPASCLGPVKLFQTHGWRDRTVPIEGRSLRNGQFVQGDIFAGLEIWRAANGCAGANPSSFSETGAFWRRKWANCAPGAALEFALFPGGHTVPQGWSDMILDWFEDATRD